MARSPKARKVEVIRGSVPRNSLEYRSSASQWAEVRASALGTALAHTPRRERGQKDRAGGIAGGETERRRIHVHRAAHDTTIATQIAQDARDWTDMVAIPAVPVPSSAGCAPVSRRHGMVSSRAGDRSSRADSVPGRIRIRHAIGRLLRGPVANASATASGEVSRGKSAPPGSARMRPRGVSRRRCSRHSQQAVRGGSKTGPDPCGLSRGFHRQPRSL